MDENIKKSLIKCITWGIIWAVILFVVAAILVETKNYLLKDVLFIEGIIFVMIGVFASIGGDPMGLTLQSMGQSNTQYTATANLEAAKTEEGKTKTRLKTTISSSVNSISLIIAGIVTILINFLI
ncbi:MAG: hypothetical protein RR620_00420 [Clostridium sp.]